LSLGRDTQAEAPDERRSFVTGAVPVRRQFDATHILRPPRIPLGRAPDAPRLMPEMTDQSNPVEERTYLPALRWKALTPLFDTVVRITAQELQAGEVVACVAGPEGAH
jgi:hypothetical protein